MNATRNDKQGAYQRDETDVFVDRGENVGGGVKDSEIIDDNHTRQSGNHLWVMTAPPVGEEKRSKRDHRQYGAKRQCHPRVDREQFGFSIHKSTISKIEARTHHRFAHACRWLLRADWNHGAVSETKAA